MQQNTTQLHRARLREGLPPKSIPMQSVSHPPRRAFRAPLGLRHRHVQSLLAAWALRQGLLRRRARGLLAGARREIVDCGDGVRLLGMHTPSPGESRGLAILLHGWEGSAEATYVLSLGATLHAARLRRVSPEFSRSRRDSSAESRAVPFVPNRRGRRGGARHDCRTSGPAHVRGRPFARGKLRATCRGARADAGHRAREGRRHLSGASASEHDARTRTGLWIYREYFLRRWRRSLLAKAACFPELYDFGDLRRFATLTATTEFS